MDFRACEALFCSGKLLVAKRRYEEMAYEYADVRGDCSAVATNCIGKATDVEYIARKAEKRLENGVSYCGVEPFPGYYVVSQ